MIKKKLLSIPFFAGCFITVASCFLFSYIGLPKPVLLSGIDNKIMDTMFFIRGPEPHTGRVVIVDIDEKSLQLVGQWPWPRNMMANLTRAIRENGASAIGFDMVFPEPDRTSPARQLSGLTPLLREHLSQTVLDRIMSSEGLDYDVAFGNEISKGKVILGYVFQFIVDKFNPSLKKPYTSAQIHLFSSDATLEKLTIHSACQALVNVKAVSLGETEGFLNVFADYSGTVRSVPLLLKMDNVLYPSLALEAWRLGIGNSVLYVHTDKRFRSSQIPVMGVSSSRYFIPTSSDARLLLNHRGPARTFEYISAWDLLDHPDHPELANKIVLIGSSATGLFDFKATPFSNAMPGVEINATVIDNLLKQDPFEYDIFTETAIIYTMILFGGMLLTMILCLATPILSGLSTILFFIALFMGNYYFFFLNKIQVGITYVVLVFLCVSFVVSILNYFMEGRAKSYIHKAFSHYVSPGVVRSLLRNPARLSLAGEQKELTILFSDIRNFSSLSENMDSQVLGRFMNQYLTRMSRIIMENGGTVDKFIGDAVMAFWGAPADEPDHAAKAVRTALLMQGSLRNFNKSFTDVDLPEISIGIGINTGMVSVGNFGSMDRFDYTVMGDNVNLASRLENTNKEYGTTILVSESVARTLKGRFKFRYVDQVKVKGRAQLVKIYEPGFLS